MAQTSTVTGNALQSVAPTKAQSRSPISAHARGAGHGPPRAACASREGCWELPRQRGPAGTHGRTSRPLIRGLSHYTEEETQAQGGGTCPRSQAVEPRTPGSLNPEPSPARAVAQGWVFCAFRGRAAATILPPGAAGPGAWGGAGWLGGLDQAELGQLRPQRKAACHTEV